MSRTSARARWSSPTATSRRPKARQAARRELWANRDRYATRYLSIAEAMDRAASHNQGPLVLADRADNPGSGAPGDSTVRAEGAGRAPDRARRCSA
jgi:microcystin degradation protein MlrC